MSTSYNAADAQAIVESNLINANFYFTQLDYGLQIDINVSHYSNKSAEYPFHIHQLPVITDCLSTKRHLDPHDRNPNGNSTSYKCEKDDFDTCELGDLSGKFVLLDAYHDTYSFVDPTLDIEDLKGKTSIVVHLDDAAKTRIACASIVDVD